MASCMECIHFNPCNVHGKIIVEKPTEGNDWGLHNNVENMCQHFTPTADVVEVVRCKDCMYRNTISCNAKHERSDMDFCSHGLPKRVYEQFSSYGEEKGEEK